MGLLANKVAFVTGAARGQGRSHALRLAQEGADIIALDICSQDIGTVNYDLATRADLDETVRLIESVGRRVVAGVGDVRELDQVQKVVDEGLAAFGHIDIVCANAGIGAIGVSWEITAENWRDVIDTNLTGVFNTTRAALPSMVERGQGGSVILISSATGINGYRHTAHYTAAKHGVIGLMKVLAQETGTHNIRVNAVCPTNVNTPLIINQETFDVFAPHIENPGVDDVRDGFASLHVLPNLPWVEPSDVSEAVLWLSSEHARYVTGVSLPIDAGNAIKKG
ncbi:mycofactocin-coupled SDR family oxidoreductase [Rhodococcus sp. 14C212]|uniref:mycofactocin-coupled SDR family oxidoreductase n=1 Tax=Rhodococcus sp. 14C212 TaxID=2711209 RepID=UPI0013ECFD39|nr:mycofactocin-coupled SDR family oxidoreductase [Rhodococcus sp. 14C212]NGP06739.1 mycofactocin-coupled SDR family oxidoreductase [Rhodococcus sp. 14C212]